VLLALETTVLMAVIGNYGCKSFNAVRQRPTVGNQGIGRIYPFRNHWLQLKSIEQGARAL
jgi:hypothetical protein